MSQQGGVVDQSQAANVKIGEKYFGQADNWIKIKDENAEYDERFGVMQIVTLDEGIQVDGEGEERSNISSPPPPPYNQSEEGSQPETSQPDPEHPSSPEMLPGPLTTPALCMKHPHLDLNGNSNSVISNHCPENP